MAIWQFSFYILPNEALGSTLRIDADGLFDDAPYWQATKKPCDFFAPLDKLLPRGKSWSESLTVYGELDSNCLEVFCENKVIESVTCRIDYLTDFDVFMEHLFLFCGENDLFLLSNDLEIVPMNITALKAMVESSPQMQRYTELQSE